MFKYICIMQNVCEIISCMGMSSDNYNCGKAMYMYMYVVLKFITIYMYMYIFVSYYMY